MAERGLRSVILIGGGEPTLYPRFADFRGFLKELELQVAIVSQWQPRARCWPTPPLTWTSATGSASRSTPAATSCSSDAQATCKRRGSGLDLRVDPEDQGAQPEVRVGFSYIIVWGGASRDDEKIYENIDEIVMAAERAKAPASTTSRFKPVLERQADGAEVMDPEKPRGELDA